MTWGRVLALHIRQTENVGDRASSPATYLDFGGRVKTMDVGRYLKNPPTWVPDLLVVGGGVWRHDYQAISKRPELAGTAKVAWGVGVSRQNLSRSPLDAHVKKSEGWDMYAHRDVGLEGRFLPCASCLHPAFDDPPAPSHEVVYFAHHWLAPLPACRGIGPYRTNRSDCIEEVVDFLASGEVIVTSSYHGAYWGRLLGRKVAMIPRASKFFHLPPAPVSLAEHRELHHRYRAEVRALMEADV